MLPACVLALSVKRRLVKQFPAAAVVQKASIDEAFIACHKPESATGNRQ